MSLHMTVKPVNPKDQRLEPGYLGWMMMMMMMHLCNSFSLNKPKSLNEHKKIMNCTKTLYAPAIVQSLHR